MPDRRGSSPEPEPRYTFLVIPEGGRGGVIERTWSRRRLQGVLGLAGGLVALLALGAIVQVATLSRVLRHDALVAENARLVAELDATQGQLAELDPLVQRVRAYDEVLRKLAAQGAFPGTGPLDEASAAEREAWLNGVAGDAPAEPEVDAETLFAELRGLDLDTLELNLQHLQQSREAMPQLWPVDGPVNSGFGWRRDPFGRRWKFHGGLDIGADYGTPILATGAGVVSFSGWHSGNGRMVELDHGDGIVSRYSHASSLLVSEGDEVFAGETIALVGSSGRSTGAHLHYELFLDGERVDPSMYLPDPDFTP